MNLEGMILGVATGVTNLVAAVGVAVAGASLAINGLKYHRAGGGKQSEDAATWIIRSLVGLGVSLGAVAIVSTLRSWLGL